MPVSRVHDPRHCLPAFQKSEVVVYIAPTLAIAQLRAAPASAGRDQRTRSVPQVLCRRCLRSLPRHSRSAKPLRMTPARPRGRPPYRRPRKLRALSPPAPCRRPQSCEGRRRHPRGPNGDTLPLLRHPDVALKTHTHSCRLTRLPRWAPNPGLAPCGINRRKRGPPIVTCPPQITARISDKYWADDERGPALP